IDDFSRFPGGYPFIADVVFISLGLRFCIHIHRLSLFPSSQRALICLINQPERGDHWKSDKSCISNPEISKSLIGLSNLRFPISDLRCRIRPISRFSPLVSLSMLLPSQRRGNGLTSYTVVFRIRIPVRLDLLFVIQMNVLGFAELIQAFFAEFTR